MEVAGPSNVGYRGSHSVSGVDYTHSECIHSRPSVRVWVESVWCGGTQCGLVWCGSSQCNECLIYLLAQAINNTYFSL